MKSLLALALCAASSSLNLAMAQPPVRKFDDKGAPPFKVLKEGENPPLDAYDNFVIGPKYPAAPERKKGTAELTRLESFCAHVKRHKDKDTVIFAVDGSRPARLKVVRYT